MCDRRTLLRCLALGTLSLIYCPQALAIPIAGVDFDDGAGGDTTLPEDRNLGDDITVSDWTFEGVGGIPGVDNNSNTGRPSAPVRKFNGPNNSSPTPPAIGDAPPTDGVHSFSITIGTTPITLTNVKFQFSNATGSANQRWIAFRTSLDSNIIFSQNGVARPEFPEVDIVLADAKYSNLSNQTVDFIWYSGGQGSGDSDIDSIVIEADGGSFTDTDGDLLGDGFEQQIIDADPDDAINTLADVLPADDFDNDGASNIKEQGDITDPTDPDTDNDGYEDGVETNDGNFVDLNATGTDPRVRDTDEDGLLDGVETNTGTFVDAMNTGTNPLNPDTDSDTIDDAYEVANNFDPHSDDSALDPDSDMSDNLAEYNNGTDPRDPDSDDDDLIDGIEDNSGTFVSATATGTDPLDPDTDGDGFSDGIETNDGTFDDALTDTGTNPLLEDSDSDDFRDGAEVDIHGTDPNSAASVPGTALSALFIGAGGQATAAADGIAMRYIQDKYGLSGVTYLQASATDETSEDAFDLLVISSTPGSGDMRDKFEDSLVPIVNWEEALSDNGAGEFGLCSEIIIKSIVTTEIEMTDHPISNGLPSTVVLFDAPGPQTTSSAALFPGLTSAGNEPGTGNTMILTADVGEAVDPGALVPGDVAPARRVMLPWTDSTIGNLTADGFRLFGNAMDWAVGRIGSADEGIRITEILFDDTSDPGNIIVTLKFTSELDVLYSIETAPDFASPIPQWFNVNDGVDGGDGTTTYVINFEDSFIPTEDPRRFFVVRLAQE